VLLEPGGAPLRGAFPAEATPAWFAVRRGELRLTSSPTLEPLIPHVVSSDEIAPHEILLLVEIPG
jgi:hypothetical protein